MFRRIFRTSDEDYKKKLDAMDQTPDGAELLDSTPMSPPIGYVKTPSMVETIREMIRSEKLRAEALAEGEESFEDADDFVVDEDDEPISEYEFERYFEPHAEELNPPAPENLGQPLNGDPLGPRPPSPEKPSGEAPAPTAPPSNEGVLPLN